MGGLQFRKFNKRRNERYLQRKGANSTAKLAQVRMVFQRRIYLVQENSATIFLIYENDYLTGYCLDEGDETGTHLVLKKESLGLAYQS